MSANTLFAELRRRNVFRVGAAYAVVAWLLIEISDTVFPRLQLPEWTVTFVIVVLLLGFPLARFRLLEELLNLLALVRDLLVASRTSAFGFRAKNTPIPEFSLAGPCRPVGADDFDCDR